jgi:hypothetical protein
MEKINQLQLELGSIVTGRFYEFQEIRLGTMNRLRNIVFRRIIGIDIRELQKKKKKTDEEKQWLNEFSDSNIISKLNQLFSDGRLSESDRKYIDKMFVLLNDIKEKEKGYEKLIKEFVEKEPIWTGFGKYVKGMGHLMTAMVLYYFGYCEKARYPSSLWKFSGFYPDAKFVKGETGGFNPKCRTTLWKLGDCFIKQRSPRYRPVYDTEKARQLKLMETKSDNAPKRLGHADARARRKMMKKFLVDYYRVCKTITNQEQSKIWIIDKGGHTHFDDVLVWLEKQKKAEKII